MQFERNYSECKRLGIPVGAYWYSYAKTTTEAEQEAAVCLSALAGKQFEYPIAFDIEEQASLQNAGACVRRFAVRWSLPGIMRQFIRSSRLWKAVSGTI